MTDVTDLAVVDEIPALASLEGLDDGALARVNSLFQTMSAQPDGFEGDVRWQPENLKLRHAIMSDDLMPPETEVGDLYVPGRHLWSRENDGKKNPFKFVLCYGYQSRARFPDGDNRPDCTSSDTVWNDFGTLKCANCPDLPFRNGSPTNCNNSWNMVILPLDLSGVYIARFSKSSYKAGSNIKKLLRGSQNTYDRACGLITTQKSNSSHSWEVYQTTSVSDPVPEEVKLFAGYISQEYGAMRKAYLDELKERRENVEEGLGSMEAGLDELADEDDGGFEDTM